MKFSKYQGAGNDFLIVENRDGSIPEGVKRDLALRLCHRRFGVGGDGLLLIEPPEEGTARMRIFNPDGTEAEMCGNGLRCFVRYLYDRGEAPEEGVVIETLAGPKEAKPMVVGGLPYIQVRMGEPKVEDLDLRLPLEGEAFTVHWVDIGVPHAVLFVEDLDGIDVRRIGGFIRSHEHFPKGTNVDFLQQEGENRFSIRTYERGVEDETLACGTGVAAGGAVALLLGRADPQAPVEVKARGGKLWVTAEWEGDRIRELLLLGPAEPVFEGEIRMKISGLSL
jgi:diaminopimelate epimerase